MPYNSFSDSGLVGVVYLKGEVMPSLSRLRKKAVTLSDQSWETIWKEDEAVVWVSIPKNINGNVQLVGKKKNKSLLFKWAGNVWVKIVGDVSLEMCGSRIAGVPALEKSADDALVQYVVRLVPGVVPRTRVVSYHTMFFEYKPALGDVTHPFGPGIFAIRDAEQPK